MFTLGIPKTQYRRATQVLGHERSEPIEYNAERQDDGFYIFKFPFADEYDFKDIVKLLKQNGITTIGADDQLTERQIMKLVDLVPLEEMDINDPVLMRMRAQAAADKQAEKDIDNIKRMAPKSNRKSLTTLKKLGVLNKERERLMRDMEQEAEPEGGPIADKYGAQLNRIDKAIAKLKGSETMTYNQAIAKEGSCGYGEDGKPGDKPAGPDLIRRAIRKEIKSLNEDNSNKGYQEARKLIDQLRAKTYRSFSDEELDAFSKEMALHFIDNQAAEAAIMVRSAKMKGDDYKPGTTDELPFE